MKNFKFFALTLIILFQSINLAESTPSTYNKLKYESSLVYTQFTSTGWWTKIEPYNLYLGALPLKNKGHLDQILELGVTRVLSLVEDFELEDGWLNRPVKSQDWIDRSLEVKHIPAEDFLPVKAHEIAEGIEYLAQMLDEGHTVYVHCKAGRGRSATIVIAYLMQYQGISLEEAIAFVKEQRPQINLNPSQRQAILDYFGQSEEPPPANNGYLSATYQITQDALTKLLYELLDLVIEGVKPGDHLPETLASWVPSRAYIESTYSRRNRYLREFHMDQDAATQVAIERNHGLKRKILMKAFRFVPTVGAPTSYSVTLWYQLREIALIAALHGHDLHDPEVRMQILATLVEGDLRKIPALSVDLIVERILVKIGLGFVPLPAHLVCDYFTENWAKVATQAKASFAGENSLPIIELETR